MQQKSNFEIPQIYSTLTFPTKIEESVIEKGSKSLFTVSPVKKGFGTTLANSLRRALLSSIHGTCITGLKITGISHAFSQVSGIKEDVSTIIANLRDVVISSLSPIAGKHRISFKASKKGEFTAGMITLPSDISILNPNKVLFTVIDAISIDFDIFLTSGFGYVKASQNEERDISLISIDAYYSPISNVSFTTEEQIVGEKDENQEKLKLIIETNGTIKPIEALKTASYLVRQHYKFVIDFNELDLFQKDEIKMDINPYLIKKVTELELSVRASNCLQKEKIMYVGELIQYSEADLIKTPNFGKKSLDEIKEVLETINLSLGTPIENWDEIRKNYIDNGKWSS